MHLERLEINGFKSFSDRSELAFDKGVTAIVGPNGCGKSNVADAITWVMGEQSAKSLRGDKMEDVIFSGSDARKPTAAAEVRLRFSGVLKNGTPLFPDEVGSGERALGDNGNGHNGNGNGHANGNGNGHGPAHGVGDLGPRFSRPEAEEIIESVAREVEVTRRLYRSGESEYLIDGQICRLRDIHDLLMDTGLGAKAYAIIEQGKIGLILSSRPTDRRQLIEEAAGVTKYKARRRSAELKLEAAQQNLTRIDDIVFEVEKQRGTLKRQAAKARRYRKLREELRRWEKVLFSRKYRQLEETVQAGRARLHEARERESIAAAHLAGIEADFGRARIDLVEAESRATEAREAAHARELAINRQQQKNAFEQEQIQALTERIASVSAEAAALAERRAPARELLAARTRAAAEANSDRDRASVTLTVEVDAYEGARQGIEGLEADVEAARSEVFSAINAATALRHSLEHAASARDRALEILSKLQIETDDARIEADRVEADKTTASEGLRRALEGIETIRSARTAREMELAQARIEHEQRSRAVHACEHEITSLEARLKSLEELQAGRVEYGDAARRVLAEANGSVSQQGAVADYLEVESGYERAAEACLGDLLQYVIVERPEHAAAGFELVRDEGAGRCGFLVTTGSNGRAPTLEPPTEGDGLIPLLSVVRVNGRFAGVIRQVIGEAWIAPSYERAADASGHGDRTIATINGDLFRGRHLIVGGHAREGRGILETKREIRELASRLDSERNALHRLVQEAAAQDRLIAEASGAIAALDTEHHRQEKTILVLESQLHRASEETTRIGYRNEQLGRERRATEEERDALERRQEEAYVAIARLEQEQRMADERLTTAQRRIFEAREAMEDLSRRTAEAGASHAALVERANALAAEVQRLEDASTEIERRAAALETELDENGHRLQTLRSAVIEGQRQLDADVVALDAARGDVIRADEHVSGLRIKADECDVSIKTARTMLESIRTAAGELEIARATAESDLAHLADACLATVQATLDQVVMEVADLEREGALVPDSRVVLADESEDVTEDGDTQAVDLAAPAASVVVAEQQTLSAEDAIIGLRAKIDHLGPVNMMAIEQFDELESRHGFLTTQRKDLVDSIAQTSEAIKRINQTTRERFSAAFAAINHNFQQMFSSLFGGGRAGLTLLDENDPLESGIEIIAQPPGKRLQSVQLLSGGEKALTAIALMFGLFKYRPSPFCLLDEIDAPLDDANIGRFVEMLRSMQEHTQFILITHNRKTMEIADRLYGVTMEEPGVSKLISVQLN